MAAPSFAESTYLPLDSSIKGNRSPGRAHRAIRHVGGVLGWAMMASAPAHPAPIRVRHDINTAPDGDLATIPGVGKVLVNALLDGRPWISRTQFRDSIGRHVDPDVLDLLEAHLLMPADPALASPNCAPTPTGYAPAPVPVTSDRPARPTRRRIAAGSLA